MMKPIIGLFLFLAGLAVCQAASHPEANKLRNRNLNGSKSAKSPKGRKLSKAGKGAKCPKVGKDGGAVYTMTNADSDNELLAYSQDDQTGILAFEGAFDMGGDGGILSGTGQEDPIASQDAIIVSGRCVLAVNAGSHTVASFKIGDDDVSPDLVGAVDSNGFYPVSLASNDDGIVYVLNAGGNGIISGYNLDCETCELTEIADSTVELPQNVMIDEDVAPFFASSPAQIGFTPNGNIIVTIKSQDGTIPPATGQGSIVQYDIDDNGAAIQSSETQEFVMDGTVPFSFDYDSDGNLILVEAFGDQDPLTPNTGAVTTYSGDTPTFLERVGTGGTATCWVKYSEKNGCTFTTNNGGTITSLKVDDGSISLVASEAATLDHPIDLNFSRDEKFVYALSTGPTPNHQPRIYAYEVDDDCGLREVQDIANGIPDGTVTINGAAGLAVF